MFSCLQSQRGIDTSTIGLSESKSDQAENRSRVSARRERVSSILSHREVGLCFRSLCNSILIKGIDPTDLPHRSSTALSAPLDSLSFAAHSFKLRSFRFERVSFRSSDYLWLDHDSCWIGYCLCYRRHELDWKVVRIGL